jgi:hypothetical protein
MSATDTHDEFRREVRRVAEEELGIWLGWGAHRALDRRIVLPDAGPADHETQAIDLVHRLAAVMREAVDFADRAQDVASGTPTSIPIPELGPMTNFLRDAISRLFKKQGEVLNGVEQPREWTDAAEAILTRESELREPPSEHAPLTNLLRPRYRELVDRESPYQTDVPMPDRHLPRVLALYAIADGWWPERAVSLGKATPAAVIGLVRRSVIRVLPTLAAELVDRN